MEAMRHKEATVIVPANDDSSTDKGGGSEGGER